MKQKHNTLSLSLILLASACFSQNSNEQLLRSANELYKNQQYDQAESAYDKILEKNPHDANVRFNLANTYYRRSKKDDAIKIFEYLTGDGIESELRQKSFYNKGVVLSRQEKLEESIAAYKDALRLNPNDTLARENLQKAMEELKKKQPPPPREEPKKKQEPKKQKQQQNQSKMNRQEAEQRLKMLEQKEKQVLQRMQSEKSKAAGTVAKDW